MGPDGNRQFCRDAKALSSRIPVIVVCDPSVDAHVEVMAAGADTFLLTPVFPDELLDVVDRLLAEVTEIDEVGTETRSISWTQCGHCRMSVPSSTVIA